MLPINFAGNWPPSINLPRGDLGSTWVLGEDSPIISFPFLWIRLLGPVQLTNSPSNPSKDWRTLGTLH